MPAGKCKGRATKVPQFDTPIPLVMNMDLAYKNMLIGGRGGYVLGKFDPALLCRFAVLVGEAKLDDEEPCRSRGGLKAFDENFTPERDVGSSVGRHDAACSANQDQRKNSRSRESMHLGAGSR